MVSNIDTNKETTLYIRLTHTFT